MVLSSLGCAVGNGKVGAAPGGQGVSRGKGSPNSVANKSPVRPSDAYTNKSSGTSPNSARDTKKTSGTRTFMEKQSESASNVPSEQRLASVVHGRETAQPHVPKAKSIKQQPPRGHASSIKQGQGRGMDSCETTLSVMLRCPLTSCSKMALKKVTSNIKIKSRSTGLLCLFSRTFLQEQLF